MKQDNAGVRIPPPTVFVVLSVTGLLLQKIMPLNMHLSEWVKYLGLGTFILTAVGLVYMIYFFKKHQTEIEPWRSTERILTSGPFRFSRNPIYLLSCGIPIGLAFGYHTYWPLIMLPPSILIVQYWAIVREEKYLEAKFGEEYLSYKSKVRRWL